MRFVQIYHNNWDTHANVAGRLPDQCRDVDQALLRPDPGSQAARPARRNAGHLGRRVRPHDLLAGRPCRRRTTAAIITRAASRCGWPAAASKAGTIYGETDDFSYNIVDRPGAHPRLPRHGAAPAGLRPRAVHVQVPGARPAADRRRALPRRVRVVDLSASAEWVRV